MFNKVRAEAVGDEADADPNSSPEPARRTSSRRTPGSRGPRISYRKRVEPRWDGARSSVLPARSRFYSSNFRRLYDGVQVKLEGFSVS